MQRAACNIRKDIVLDGFDGKCGTGPKAGCFSGINTREYRFGEKMNITPGAHRHCYCLGVTAAGGWINTNSPGISPYISRLTAKRMRLAATLFLFAVPTLALAQHQTVNVAFNYQIGGTVPAPQTYIVAFPSCCLLSGQINGIANWLNASFAGFPIGSSPVAYMASPPETLSISVNPIGLGVGTYTATVHLFLDVVEPGLAFSYDAVVTLTVSAILPQYADTAYFTYRIGGTSPAPQYFSIISHTPGTTATNITFHTSGQSWLQASLSGTSTPTTLTIAVNPVGLAVGNYSAAVIVSNPSSELDYYVSLTVTPAPPPLTASPTNMVFNAVQSGSVPASQQLVIGSQITGATIWCDNTTLPSWLKINNSSWFLGVGTPPWTLQVSVDPSGLSPGTYSTSFRFFTTPDSISSAPGQSVTVSISLVVTAPPPVLKTNTTQLQFQYLAGSTTPAAQPVQITSSGTQLAATVSLSVPWLTASPLNGTTPFTVNVGVNPTGMATGTYSGQVVVSSGTGLFGGNLSTQTISVSLSISPDLRPVITSAVNGASFKAGIGPGTWISIIGSKFSNTTKQVSAPFFTSLNGVSAQLSGVGGAYSLLMYYLSPTQINAFVPLELPPSFFGNSCSLAVTTSGGTTSYTTQCLSLTPALFNYGSQHYASATHIDGTIVGVVPGTSPAQSGSIITLWGTGFGETTPATSTTNMNYSGTGGTLAAPVVVLINNTSVKVLYAGMVGLGLYQFNIQLPDGLASGDYSATIQIGGTTSDPVMLPVQ